MHNSSLQKIRQFFKPHMALVVPLLIVLIILFGWLSYRSSPLYIFGGLGVTTLTMVIFRNPWHGLYLLAFFLPFERIGSYDIAGSTVRPSQITALLALLSALFYYMSTKKFSLPKLPILAPMGIFIVVQLFGLLNAPNLQRSLLVTAFIIFTFSIALLVPFLLTTKTHLRILLGFLFNSLLLVGLFGLFQFAGDLAGLPPEITGLRELYTKEILGFPRVQSTALEPLYFANYLLIPLSILLSLFFARSKEFHPLIIVGLLGLGLINLVLTVARGGYIAFALSAVLIVGYYFIERKLLTWRNMWYLFLGLTVSLIIVSQVLDFQEVSQKFTEHVLGIFNGASYSERVEMFEVANLAWLEHPLVGIGSGSFGPYESAHPYVIPEHGWRIVNNEYLEILAENGVFGLITMLTLFLIVLIRSLKAIFRATDPFIRAVLIGAFAAFSGTLLQYNTFSILYIVHIWFLIGFLIALQNMVFSKKQ